MNYLQPVYNSLRAILLFQNEGATKESYHQHCDDHHIHDFCKGVDVGSYQSSAHSDTCCSICLEDFESHDEVALSRNCSHIHHRECLHRWMLHRHNSCPSCRLELLPHGVYKKWHNWEDDFIDG
mmetsp:Transcript_22329/g.36019  ORF Transcript_22329/g.36019 Transcript_22329/m.36019 type:complete len:124 (-) Transcript_22329:1006-1377(-)